MPCAEMFWVGGGCAGLAAGSWGFAGYSQLTVAGSACGRVGAGASPVGIEVGVSTGPSGVEAGAAVELGRPGVLDAGEPVLVVPHADTSEMAIASTPAMTSAVRMV